LSKPTEQPDDLSGPTEDNPLAHTWIVAAEIRVSDKIAKHADFRGSFRTKVGQRVDALETYCRACRRPYDDVADAPCEAQVDNTHLIGGDPGVRKKRNIPEPPPGSRIVPGPRVTRVGVDAYVNG